MALETAAGKAVDHFKMTVSPPPKGRRAIAESTQRSRSIIFLGLGLLVASALPSGTPLIVPENGFISLNVPLTLGRLGSLSTRTTHPYTMALMRDVLERLELPIPLLAPYRFHTKGQMLQQTRNPDILGRHIRVTHSCARPNERNADASRPQAHCGYCVPCIIRRAAMRVIDVDDPSDYRFDLQRERSTLLASSARGQDLWAFEIALSRARNRADITDLLRAGPLPVKAEEVDGYIKVYRDGLDEVSRFLSGRPAFR